MHKSGGQDDRRRIRQRRGAAMPVKGIQTTPPLQLSVYEESRHGEDGEGEGAGDNWKGKWFFFLSIFSFRRMCSFQWERKHNQSSIWPKKKKRSFFIKVQRQWMQKPLKDSLYFSDDSKKAHLAAPIVFYTKSVLSPQGVLDEHSELYFSSNISPSCNRHMQLNALPCLQSSVQNFTRFSSLRVIPNM